MVRLSSLALFMLVSCRLGGGFPGLHLINLHRLEFPQRSSDLLYSATMLPVSIAPWFMRTFTISIRTEYPDTYLSLFVVT